MNTIPSALSRREVITRGAQAVAAGFDARLSGPERKVMTLRA